MPSTHPDNSTDNENDKRSDFIQELQKQLQEHAYQAVARITQTATSRFEDVVACWGDLAENDRKHGVSGQRAETESFKAIFTTLVDQAEIDIEAHGASTVLATLIMGAKLHHDATDTTSQSGAERAILRRVAKRLEENECSPRAVQIVNNMIQEVDTKV